MTYKSDIEKANRIKEAENFPEVILIENSNCCNLHCTACDHKNIAKYRPFKNMELALYKKIIDEIAVENPKARVWEIFFGEPFLVPDIAARIKYAKDKGLKDVVTNTNGTLMDEKKAQAVIESGLDAIYVGIDAANEEDYNKIRAGGDFYKTRQNIINYKKLLDKYGKPEQKIFAQFVLSEENERGLDDFKKFWADQGVNVKIRPKVSWGGLVSAPNLWRNEEIERKPCYWLMKTMNICADGEVALCSVDMHCQVKCGNAKELSLKELWRGQLREYRKMHLQNRFDELPELCRACRDWQSAYAEYC
ncbi:MAG: radical SAM protein [Candidatus Portnoybacteria bacterium]|nr:radical SAM protein [Candidatus Portnoybacteria bacterium]MDD4982474.1 radical SAM protein [Candidatus Portnoybacteria bacterium]